MFWSVCSSKGGVGTSVVAAAIASCLASEGGDRVVLIDFGGDQGDIFGIDVVGKPGVVDWLTAASDVGADTLENLSIDIAPGFTLLPRGLTTLPTTGNQVHAERCAELVQGFGDDTIVVADVGVLDDDPVSPRALIAASGDRTTAVLRACYLALRRATRVPVVIDDVVEVVEIGRSLSTMDIEAVVGMPVSARIRLEPGVARTVDAGLLATRLPRSLRRLVSDLLTDVPQRGSDAALEGRMR